MSPKKAAAKVDNTKVQAAKAKAPLGSEAEGRCMKCREQVAFEVAEHSQWSNGMVVAMGNCGTCGTKVTRILGKA